MQDPENRSFLSISSAMTDLLPDSVDSFWLSVKFYKHQLKYRDLLPVLVGVSHYMFSSCVLGQTVKEVWEGYKYKTKISNLHNSLGRSI